MIYILTLILLISKHKHEQACTDRDFWEAHSRIYRGRLSR